MTGATSQNPEMVSKTDGGSNKNGKDILNLDDLMRANSAGLSGAVSGMLQRFGVGGARTLNVDFAWGTDVGRREYQEDAARAEHLPEGDVVVCVLADGMGGHAAGDVASGIVIDTVFNSLKQSLSGEVTSGLVRNSLLRCVAESSREINNHIKKNKKNDGMGSTLVGAVLWQGALYWVSVGDSPLYLMRGGSVYQINEDHSMAPQIDQMAVAGMLSVEEARCHPDRNRLTSALTGQPPSKIDACQVPVLLSAGDTIVLASDGLQYMSDHGIKSVLKKHGKESATVLKDALLKSVLDLNDPEQDNIGVIAVQLSKAGS